MSVRGGTRAFGPLLFCQVVFATCSPFLSSNQAPEISSQLSNCKNVIYFPNVEYPVLTSNKLIFNNQCGCGSTQNCGPFRPKNYATSSDEDDSSYKDPKWWKMMSEKLKTGNNKATETSNVALTNTKLNSNQPQTNTLSVSSRSTAPGYTESASKVPQDVNSSGTVQSLLVAPGPIQNSSPISTESGSNLTPSSPTMADLSQLPSLTGGIVNSLSTTPNTMQTMPTISYQPVGTPSSMISSFDSSQAVSTLEVTDYMPAGSSLERELLPAFADSASPAGNDQLNTLDDVNTSCFQNSLSPLDSVASAISNLILNPSSVQKRKTATDNIGEKASFVWMAIPYVDENSTASVIPLVVLKFPPLVLNNSMADNSTIEKILVDSLKKQDVHDIINATKIKEALLNKTISVVDYYKPFANDSDGILNLTNQTEANITSDSTFAFLFDKSNNTSMLIDKIKNEVLKSEEAKPDSIVFYVDDLVQNTSTNTGNNTETLNSDDQEQNSTTNLDKIADADTKPKEDINSGEYFKTIIIKIIRKSDNLTDSKQIDIVGDVTYKTDNLVIQIIDENTDEG